MEFFKNNNLRISVRDIVEFVFREGDIDTGRIGHIGSVSAEAMLEGGKIHRKYQKSMGKDYHAEYPLKTEYDYGRFTLSLEGRADGILDDGRGKSIMIDEIKGTYRDVMRLCEPFYVHKAQALCYGYMYGTKNEYEDMKIIRIRLTYINLDTEEINYFEEDMTYGYIKEWFNALIGEYGKWVEYMYKNIAERNKSAERLEFPFQYRDGQKEIVKSVYTSILREKEIYIQAPTGVGKTMSVIFPAIKAMGMGKADKIFYLTAKGVTGTVAVSAFRILRERGLHFKNVSITAKEKMCILEKPQCNPISCERAKGHYDRINEAVFDIISNEFEITREVILRYAEKHNVCPFEMSLDISEWVDGIICDYNYAFDYNVRLRRYFADGISGEYVLLVDEAHNLVDRAREMYSAVLYKEDFLSVKNLVKEYDRGLTKALDKCNKIMLSYKREGNGYRELEYIEDFTAALLSLFGKFEKFFGRNTGAEEISEVLRLYFNIRHFNKIYDNLDECYRIYSMIDENGDFFIKLLCVNPSHALKECIDKTVSTIFFSATLLPVNYYKELFTGNTEDYAIYTDSPFDVKKRFLFAGCDVSSRYTRRNRAEYEKYCAYIRNIIMGQMGNYMVFFPSYNLMRDVYECICEDEKFTADTDIILQKSNMTEADREAFLGRFEEERDKSFAAFCVMGGIFSEGIDLTNDRLIGTIIIGTGLPGVGRERNLIMKYFDENGRIGFDYAYRFPGMNKVMQAAGRVIRTKEDVGIIALLDGRFAESSYRKLFPREWSDIKYITIENLSHYIGDFWRRSD